MGCDIHSFAEVKRATKWIRVEDALFPSYGTANKSIEPFGDRSYSIFAFLAGVRNYNHCEPISETKGLPDDSEYLNNTSYQYSHSSNATSIKQDLEEDGNYHSFSYLTLKELLDYDYEKTFWNRRIFRTIYRQDGTIAGGNGAAIAEEGEGEIVSYRDNLGQGFFEQLDILKTLGEPEDVRIVFWFDN